MISLPVWYENWSEILNAPTRFNMSYGPQQKQTTLIIRVCVVGVQGIRGCNFRFIVFTCTAWPYIPILNEVHHIKKKTYRGYKRILLTN